MGVGGLDDVCLLLLLPEESSLLAAILLPGPCPTFALLVLLPSTPASICAAPAGEASSLLDRKLTGLRADNRSRRVARPNRADSTPDASVGPWPRWISPCSDETASTIASHACQSVGPMDSRL